MINDYTNTFFKTKPKKLFDQNSRVARPGGPIALLVMVALLPKPDAASINTVRLLTSDPAKIWRQRKQ